MRKTTLLILLLLSIVCTAYAQQPEFKAPPSDTLTFDKELTINQKRDERGLTAKSNLFVPKGQWIFGGTASYSVHSNDNYSFFVIDGINSKGYTFKISPMIAYAVSDNMAIGVRFIYGRTLQKVDSADFSLGNDDSGVNINVDHSYSIQQSYTVAAFWRQYIPLGRSKRFALFTEMQFAGGGIQSKRSVMEPMDGLYQPYKGTYETGYKLSLGVSPGFIAFATNNMAIEVSVGVLGLEYTNIEQVHNQVSTGERSSANMNFKVNIFSIGLGFSFYL